VCFLDDAFMRGIGVAIAHPSQRHRVHQVTKLDGIQNKLLAVLELRPIDDGFVILLVQFANVRPVAFALDIPSAPQVSDEIGSAAGARVEQRSRTDGMVGSTRSRTDDLNGRFHIITLFYWFILLCYLPKRLWKYS